MDPEDLLIETVAHHDLLPNHIEENQRVILELQALNISYRYTRLELRDRADTVDMSERTAAKLNKEMGTMQKIRLQSAVDDVEVNVAVGLPVGEDTSGPEMD